MSWLKVDDGFATHNKVLPLSDSAVRLWLMAGCWSRLQENLKYEGKIQAALLPGISQHRYSARKLAALAQELVDADAGGLEDHGLWIPTDSGWLIHRWHKYGQVTQAPDSISAKRSEAGKVGAASRWQTDGKRHGKPMANTMASNAIANSKLMPPDPVSRSRSEDPPPPSVGPPLRVERDISSVDLASFAPEPAKILAKRRRNQQWRRFPPDFEPDETHRKLAQQLGLSLAQQLAEIRDHEFAKPKSDAAATLRTWLRNAVRFGAPTLGASRAHRPDPRNEAQDRNADHDTRAALEASRKVRELLEFSDKMAKGGA